MTKEEFLNDPAITRRMKQLCLNCQWFDSDYNQCNEIRKGFTCSKYQIKHDIEEIRAHDDRLNNPYGWLGDTAKGKTPFR